MPPEFWEERKARIWTRIDDLGSPKLTDAREDVELALWRNGHPQLDTVVRDLRIQQVGWSRLSAKLQLMTMHKEFSPEGINRSAPTLITWFPHYNKPAYEIAKWAPALAAAAR